MPAFAYSDETIRVPKLPTPCAPARSLPTRFAPARPQRWPLIALAVLALLAAWSPVRVPETAERTVQAQQLLELLRH